MSFYILIVHVGLEFKLSRDAFLKGFLEKMVTLTSHCRFISENTTTLENNTVNWNVHTGFNLDDITDNNIVSMDWDFLGVSHDFRLNISNKVGD